MKYVLDSNVALKWLLPETDDDKEIHSLALRACIPPNHRSPAVLRVSATLKTGGRRRTGRRPVSQKLLTLPLVRQDPHRPIRAYKSEAPASAFSDSPCISPKRQRMHWPTPRAYKPEAPASAFSDSPRVSTRSASECIGRLEKTNDQQQARMPP